MCAQINYITSITPALNAWLLNIKIPANTANVSSSAYSALDGINLMVREKDGNELFTNRIQNLYIEAGQDQKNDSPILYPAGYWKEGTIYTLNTYAVPYVYLESNKKYYKLIQTVTSTKASKPGSGVVWQMYWEEIDYQDGIYTENLLASSASFGSSSGALISSNYLCSQLGLDLDNNKVNYASILGEDKKIFDNKLNSSVQELTGEFKPNSYIDFYSGEVVCNKFSEHFDYFYPAEIKNGKLIYNNIYFMDLNKSHNVCVSSRYVDTGLKNGDKTIYNIRPGVVVLPKYDENDLTDGIHVCISYPHGVPDDGVVCGLYNSEYPGTTIKNSIEDSNFYKTITGPTEEGYILVCVDNEIFDETKYKNANIRSDRDDGWSTDTRSAYIKSDYEDCFVWNGWKSKFLLLTPGSELKLRSCIQYDINCTPIFTENPTENTETPPPATSTPAPSSAEPTSSAEPEPEPERMDPIIMKSNSYEVNTHEYAEIKDKNGNGIAVLRKRVIGRQWIIENPEEFSPIPLYLNIDKNDSNGTNKRLHTFKHSLKGYQLQTTNIKVHTKNYYKKINSTLIGLASGKINYRKGHFDIKIYDINNADEDIQDNVYNGESSKLNLPLVNASIFCKVIPNVRNFIEFNDSIKSIKNAFDNDYIKTMSNFINNINHNKTFLYSKYEPSMLMLENNANNASKSFLTVQPCFSFLTHPVYKYLNHYFQLKQYYDPSNPPNNSYNGYIYKPQIGEADWKDYWNYLGHTYNGSLLEVSSSNEEILRTSLINVMDINKFSRNQLSKFDGLNLKYHKFFSYDHENNPTRAVRYAYYTSTSQTAPDKPSVVPQSLPMVDTDEMEINKWYRYTYEYSSPTYGKGNNPNDYSGTVARELANQHAKSRKYIYCSYCKKDNTDGTYKTSNWSNPILIAETYEDRYYEYGKNMEYDAQSGNLHGKINNHMTQYFGWVEWTDIGMRVQNDKYITIPGTASYYDYKSSKWKVLVPSKHNIDPIPHMCYHDDGSVTSPIDLTKFQSVNNINDLNTFVASNYQTNISSEYDDHIGYNFYGGLLNKLENEPNINLYYMKVLQFGWGDGINSNSSRFFVDGPHLVGKIETEEHSVLFNEEMGTRLNDKWSYYDNPLVINLNISKDYTTYEDSGVNMSVSSDVPPVYNSTFIEQWGLYKTINPTTSVYKKARFLAYKK